MKTTASGKRDRGSFFLVDLPTFAKVCELGADVAASYLILSAGTGADNRTTTWSREAINLRTNLNWRKASACLDKLEESGRLVWVSGKGTRKPRIDLPPVETRKPMSRNVAALADKIRNGYQPTGPAEKGAAAIGRDQGWFNLGADGDWSFIETRPLVKAYLPNALVGDETGRATGRTTIIENIRKSRDPAAFRLLVDFYALQDLAEYGGIERRHFYKVYDREKAGASGSLQFWQFSGGQEYVRWSDATRPYQRKPTKEEMDAGWEEDNNAAGFFGAVRTLSDAGALEWVLCLVEDEAPDSSTIYPVAVERHGKIDFGELESLVGIYAIYAACALKGVPDEAGYWTSSLPSEALLPAERLSKRVNLVGTPRLRFRARTSNASRWRSELTETANSTITMFRGILAQQAPQLLAAADKRLADFNDGSTLGSTVLQRDINASSGSGKHHDTPSLVRGAMESPDDPFRLLG